MKQKILIETEKNMNRSVYIPLVQTNVNFSSNKSIFNYQNELLNAHFVNGEQQKIRHRDLKK